LTTRRLTLRKIFTSGMVFQASGEILIVFAYSATSLSVEIAAPRVA
jgi:hypothetical protein